MNTLNNPEPYVGSFVSVHSFKDAIQSYRRSQLISSSYRVVSSSYAGPPFRTDDEMRQTEEDDDDLLTSQPYGPPDTSNNDLDWDGGSRVISGIPIPWSSNVNVRRVEDHRTSFRGPVKVDERTSLLSRVTEEAPAPLISGRQSACVLTKSVSVATGQSTFCQTLFNATALMVGIGMLSEPLAFSYAGWIGGTLIIASYGFVTCYTAKFLASIVVSDSSVRSYADIGQRAFGARSVPFVNFLFCFETFSVGVVLVTLYADSLSAIVPAFSSNAYKLLGLFMYSHTRCFPPAVFSLVYLPRWHSFHGFLVAVIFIDGFSKFDAPGSLWSPAETSLSISNLQELGLAFGLFMAGFGAHAALPSLARDMAEPHRFSEAMNYSFCFATTVYAVIGSAGYLMFGSNVSDEVSQNLLQVPGYSPTLNRLALWMLVLTPLTKFPLTTRPLNLALECLLGLDNYTSDDSEVDQKPSATLALKFNRSLKRILVACERITLVCLAVSVSILVPNFGSIMAVLGSFTVFLLCVIGPITAKMTLQRKVTVVDATILMVSTVMAMWGTVAAFRSTTS
ncbi:transmembrane amino acid transporter protein-domain-containing protein [Lactarius hatsudake]|nr:transmembrane amino acid transporter protein-domain-containing protein [Lactarius hatsudake]